jgi:hypothetical protein
MLKLTQLLTILGLLMLIPAIYSGCNRCDKVDDPFVSPVNIRVENRSGQNLLAGPNRVGQYNNITLSYRIPSNGLIQSLGFIPSNADTTGISFYPPAAGYYFFSSDLGGKVDTLGIYFSSVNSRCISKRKVHRIDINNREIRPNSNGYYTIVK